MRHLRIANAVQVKKQTNKNQPPPPEKKTCRYEERTGRGEIICLDRILARLLLLPGDIGTDVYSDVHASPLSPPVMYRLFLFINLDP